MRGGSSSGRGPGVGTSTPYRSPYDQPASRSARRNNSARLRRPPIAWRVGVVRLAVTMPDSGDAGDQYFGEPKSGGPLSRRLGSQ
jgi:hypothetical protein